MSFIINQNFDLKSPQFNFARDYYKDIATLKAESEDNFPDHFITNVAGTLYQLTKSNSVDTNTGRWRKIVLGSDVNLSGYLKKTDAASEYSTKEYVKKLAECSQFTHDITFGERGIGLVFKNNIEGEDIIEEYCTLPEVTDSINGVMTPAQKKALEAATTKLAGIAEGANKTVVDDSLKSDSTNPVQNKVVKAALDNKASLGEDGKVDSSILPNDVYEVVEFSGFTLGEVSTKAMSSIKTSQDLLCRVQYVAKNNVFVLYDGKDFYSNWGDANTWGTPISGTITGTFTTGGRQPESGKIYVDITTNKLYRWSGEALVEVSAGVTIGETSTTAYAGDKGAKNATDIGNLTTAFNNFKGSVTSIEVCDTVTIDAMFA